MVPERGPPASTCFFPPTLSYAFYQCCYIHCACCSVSVLLNPLDVLLGQAGTMLPFLPPFPCQLHFLPHCPTSRCCCCSSSPKHISSEQLEQGQQAAHTVSSRAPPSIWDPSRNADGPSPGEVRTCYPLAFGKLCQGWMCSHGDQPKPVSSPIGGWCVRKG